MMLAMAVNCFARTTAIRIVWALFATVVTVLYLRSFRESDMVARESLIEHGTAIDHSCVFSGQGLITVVYRRITAKDWVFARELGDLRQHHGVLWRHNERDRFSKGVTAHALTTWQRPPSGIWTRAGFDLVSAYDATPNPYESTHWPIESPWTRVWALTIPYWAVAVLAWLPPLPFIWRAAWSRRRRRRGRCMWCGYDLRSSGAICPECGRQRQQSEGRPAPTR